MQKWMNLLIGGMAGTICRYLVTAFIYQKSGSSFPFGTLLVNLSGSFFIGVLWEFYQAAVISEQTRLLLMVGFLGAFTTFSAFSLEILNLIKNGDIRLSLLYIAISNIFAILLVFAGSAMARIFIK